MKLNVGRKNSKGTRKFPSMEGLGVGKSWKTEARRRKSDEGRWNLEEC